MWKRYRYHRVAVLFGPFAVSHWGLLQSLCPCVPFALSACCEHSRVVKSLLSPGDESLEVLGRPRTGRPLDPSFERGQSSARTMAAAARKADCASARTAADQQRSPFPPVINEDRATCSRSDAAACSFDKPVGGSGDASSSNRGPTEYRTDFDLVKAFAKLFSYCGVQVHFDS